MLLELLLLGPRNRKKSFGRVGLGRVLALGGLLVWIKDIGGKRRRTQRRFRSHRQGEQLNRGRGDRARARRRHERQKVESRTPSGSEKEEGDQIAGEQRRQRERAAKTKAGAEAVGPQKAAAEDYRLVRVKRRANRRKEFSPQNDTRVCPPHFIELFISRAHRDRSR